MNDELMPPWWVLELVVLCSFSFGFVCGRSYDVLLLLGRWLRERLKKGAA